MADQRRPSANSLVRSVQSDHHGVVPELVPPTPGVQASFLDALAEFRAEGNLDHAGIWVLVPTESFAGERWSGETLADHDGFAAYCGRLVELGQSVTPVPDGIVPCTHLWWVDGSTYLGRLSIRHRLTPPLFTWGGHIGYAVRPSARRRGHATAMLAAALPVATTLGIDPALVTCDVDNQPSRRVIERAGGRYEDTREGKLRYWVPTGDANRLSASAPAAGRRRPAAAPEAASRPRPPA